MKDDPGARLWTTDVYLLAQWGHRLGGYGCGCVVLVSLFVGGGGGGEMVMLGMRYGGVVGPARVRGARVRYMYRDVLTRQKTVSLQDRHKCRCSFRVPHSNQKGSPTQGAGTLSPKQRNTCIPHSAYMYPKQINTSREKQPLLGQDDACGGPTVKCSPAFLVSCSSRESSSGRLLSVRTLARS